MTNLFNSSIGMGIFPSEWKIARVVPLHMKGSRSVLDNYRPISILPVISKIFEKILYEQLYEYFTTNNLLSEQQFGFRRFHSTSTALLDCTDEWYVNMHRGIYNLVVFLDLKKAFDTVNHDILLAKLELYGIKNTPLMLFKSYLSDRSQQCQVNGELSTLKYLKYGVPQGSILSPLLFLIYINDLPNCLQHSTVRMFADDTNITVSGKSIKEAEVAVNADLNNIREWLLSNRLSLNLVKTEYLLIGSRHNINTLEEQPSVFIGDEPIKGVQVTKTLGVKIDQFLTWDSHIDQISKKISSGISAMKKIKDFTNSDTLKSVYYGLVQPHFDHCCEVWNAINRGQSERLQKLQNRCARIIMNFKDEPGQSQMAVDQLGWISLEERRKHIMARLMFKVVNNLAPSRISSMFQNSNHIHSYNLRGSNSSLFLPRPNTEYGRKCFRYSGVKICNSIPEKVRNSESLNSFNRNISSVILTN